MKVATRNGEVDSSANALTPTDLDVNADGADDAEIVVPELRASVAERTIVGETTVGVERTIVGETTVDDEITVDDLHCNSTSIGDVSPSAPGAGCRWDCGSPSGPSPCSVEATVVWV